MVSRTCSDCSCFRPYIEKITEVCFTCGDQQCPHRLQSSQTNFLRGFSAEQGLCLTLCLYAGSHTPDFCSRKRLSPVYRPTHFHFLSLETSGEPNQTFWQASAGPLASLYAAPL